MPMRCPAMTERVTPRTIVLALPSGLQ